MASRTRSFARLAADVDSSGNVTSDGISSDVSLGATVYDSIGELPTSGYTAGEQAFVKSTSRLYINSGVGWYNVAVINNTPTIQSILDSDSGTGPFSLATDGTATTITITAQDSDGDALTYTASADSDFNGLATISQASNVFTITPLSEDSATTTSGTITFNVTDNVNIANSVQTFTLTFAGTVNSGNALTSGNLIYRSSTSSTTITVSDASVTAYVGLIGGGGAGAGYYYGGGGGAGELLVTAEVTLTPGTYTFACGAGGTAPANTVGALGGNGGQSSITMSGGASIASSSTTINAYGGGRGGMDYSPNEDTDGANGGSGGGGGGSGSNAANGRAGGDAVKHSYSNWTSYANGGGAGTSVTLQGGGGGGAGAGGGSSDGAGGDGLDLRTINSDLGTAWNTVRGTYYIGGGGGGGNYRIGIGENNGGAGGGGQGDGGQSSGWDAVAGEFGGGGGGGGHTGNSGSDDTGEGGGVGAFFIYIVNGTIS